LLGCNLKDLKQAATLDSRPVLLWLKISLTTKANFMQPILKSLGVTAAVLSIFIHSALPVSAQTRDFELKDFNFWANQCRVLESQQNYNEALAACERAITLRPKSRNPQLWSSRSNVLFQLKRYAEAVASYDYLLRFDAKNSLAWMQRGAALYELGQYDDAIASLEQALKVNGNWGNSSPAMAWYNRGLALKKLGQNEAALAAFDRALTINPDNSVAILERCGTLSDLGRYDEAIAACNQAQDVVPGTALIGRAIAQQKAGQIVEAIASYEQALAVNPNDATIWTNQAILLEKLGEDDKALSSYNKAIQINPKSSLAQVNRCATLNRMGNYKEAFTSCENAIAGDGNWGDKNPAYAWNQRSSALIGLGQYPDALAAAERALNINTNFAEAWNNKGVSLWHLQKYDDAQAALQKALELNPKYSQAWFNQGRILSQIKQYKEALAAYDKALNNDINFQENLTCAEILYNSQNLGQWNLKEYENILKSAKNFCAALLANRSVTLWNLTDYQNALKSTDQAIQLNPKSLEAWYNKGVVLIDLKQYEDALAAYEQAEQLSPNNFYILTGKGLALVGLGEDQKALAAFEAALNINPNYALAQQQRDLLIEKFKSQI
jgi:tetratricopeptide (TPR) repeat protein